MNMNKYVIELEAFEGLQRAIALFSADKLKHYLVIEQRPPEVLKAKGHARFDAFPYHFLFMKSKRVNFA